MPALLDRIRSVFRPEREPFSPLGLGPEVADFDARHSSFVVASGPLAGTRLRLDATVQPGRADFSLLPASGPVSGHLTSDVSHLTSAFPGGRDSPLAHVHYDRTADGLDVLWDIVVHPELRGRGLASLITRLSLRSLLLDSRRRRAWFAIRKMMQVDTGSGRAGSRVPLTRVRLHNVGIGVIALRLGLRPEPAVTQLLDGANIAGLRLLDTGDGAPAGYLMHLRTLPGVVVACRVDPASGKPTAGTDAYRRFTSPAGLLAGARSGTVLIGNIDYELAEAGAPLFSRRLADTPTEYRTIRRLLRRPRD
jgi:GNAT superfamily N-acetyltransferase